MKGGIGLGAIVSLLVVAGLTGLGCEDDQLIVGRCQTTSDCRPGQRCEQAGPSFHRCVSPDGSIDDAGGDGGDAGDAGIADVPMVGAGDAGADHPADTSADRAPFPCQTAAECVDPGRPFCVAGICVGCQAGDAGSCPLARAFCDNATGACVGCKAGGGDPACKARDPLKPVCAGSDRCVECVDKTQCKATDKGFCVAEACTGCQLAVAACTGTTPTCNPVTGTCVECVADAACKLPTAPFCVANQCVGCASAPSGQCAQLKPTTPACSATGACVECNTSADCTLDPARPICSATDHTCRACTADSECAARSHDDPGVCLDNRGGRCASASEVIYVADGATCGLLGSRETPLCSAQDAPALFAANRAVVVIRGTLAGFAWTLTGATPALTVVGKDTAVLAAGPKPGIKLEGPGDVLLRSLIVRGSDDVGVVATGGATLRLRDTLVKGNLGGGILLDGAHFEIRNTVVSDNGPGQTGATSWGGILAVAIPGALARLDNVSIRDNKQVGLACASPVVGTAVFAKNNIGTDVATTCNLTTCDPEGAACGAPPR